VKPHLGSRYTSGHIVRRDSATGVYEELNSPLYSATERSVQRALLQPQGRSLLSRLRAAFENVTQMRRK
jgi:hypothetical protein